MTLCCHGRVIECAECATDYEADIARWAVAPHTPQEPSDWKRRYEITSQMLARETELLREAEVENTRLREERDQALRDADEIGHVSRALAAERVENTRLREALERIDGMCGDPPRDRCLCGRPTGVLALQVCARAALLPPQAEP
jgi:hypothetical protein